MLVKQNIRRNQPVMVIDIHFLRGCSYLYRLASEIITKRAIMGVLVDNRSIQAHFAGFHSGTGQGGFGGQRFGVGRFPRAGGLALFL